MVSGGADSACRRRRPRPVCRAASRSHAVHVNYGLRADSGEDEARRPGLCAKLRIDLHVERPTLGERQHPGPRPRGPLRRRRAAARRGSALTGSRPGTRAPTSPRPSSTGSPSPRARGRCSACAPRSGRRRPSAARPRARARPRAARCGRRPAVRRRPDQRRPRFARNRIRPRCCRCSRDLSPEAERNIAETQRRARRGGGAARARRRAGSPRPGAGDGLSRSASGELALLSPPAPRWRCARWPSGRPARPVALGRRRAPEILVSPPSPRAARSSSAAGCRRSASRASSASRREPSRGARAGRGSGSPGACASATGRCAPSSPGPVDPAGPELATLDAGALGGRGRGPQPGARATASARWDRWHKTLRTCSPTAACRARCATACRSSPRAGSRLGGRRRRVGGLPLARGHEHRGDHRQSSRKQALETPTDEGPRCRPG